MFEISKQFRFEAAHTLERTIEADASRRIHGHSYRAEVTLRGELDAKTGMIIDLGLLERALEGARDGLDHRFLDDVEGLGAPTLEHLARWIWAAWRRAVRGWPWSPCTVIPAATPAATSGRPDGRAFPFSTGGKKGSLPRFRQARGVARHQVDLEVEPVTRLARAPGRHRERVRDEQDREPVAVDAVDGQGGAVEADGALFGNEAGERARARISKRAMPSNGVTARISATPSTWPVTM